VKLQKLRKKIDSLDYELLDILAARIRLSKSVARFKFQNGKRIRDRKRETKLLNEMVKKAKSKGIDDTKFIKGLFISIIKKSIKVQKEQIALWEKKNGS